jgi:ribosome biogenesis SPOUT family RNA methylase Rps3
VTLDEIVREGLDVWGRQQLTPADQVAVLGKVLGDLSGLARTRQEKGAWTGVERTEWVRELGNLIATSARFIDEANRDCENAVRAALAGQRRYVERLETR